MFVIYSLYHIVYVLKKCNNLSGNLSGTLLLRYYIGGWNAKSCFHTCCLPQRTFLRQISVHFSILLLFCAPLFVENYSSVSHQFFNRCSYYYPKGYFGKKNFFTESLCLLGPILKFFGAHFGVCSSISWELFYLIL